jgi:hypothetical protein
MAYMWAFGRTASLLHFWDILRAPTRFVARCEYCEQYDICFGGCICVDCARDARKYVGAAQESMWLFRGAGVVCEDVAQIICGLMCVVK